MEIRRSGEGLVRNASDPERDPGDEDTTVSPGEERQPPRNEPDNVTDDVE